MNALLTADEIGQLLRRSASTILEWKRTGRVTAEVDTGQGGTILFDADKVIKALKASKAKRKPAKTNTAGIIPTY
jgi:hypothetical protein